MQPDLACEGWVVHRLSPIRHERRDPVWMPCAEIVRLSRSQQSRAGDPAAEQVALLAQPRSRGQVAGSR